MNKRLLALIKQANMDQYTHQTGVIRSIDDHFRIAVGGAVENKWGDCISIQIHDEHGPQGQWKFAHFSPARARLLMHHLKRAIERVEQMNPGAGCIDEPVKVTE